MNLHSLGTIALLGALAAVGYYQWSQGNISFPGLSKKPQNPNGNYDIPWYYSYNTPNPRTFQQMDVLPILNSGFVGSSGNG